MSQSVGWMNLVDVDVIRASIGTSCIALRIDG